MWLLVPAWYLLGAVAAQSEPFRMLSPQQFTEGSVAEIRISAPDAAGRTLAWRILLENAPLAAGTLNITSEGVAKLLVEVPRLRTDDALPISLVIRDPEIKKPLSIIPLWIFPEDPIADLKSRLPEDQLFLYDPPGDTATWLEALDVPFTRCSRPEEAEGAVLLIGEGIRFTRHPDLAGVLRKLAGDGMSVLCLAPRDGELYAWDSDSGPLPETWQVDGPRFVENRDKRLVGLGLETQGFALEASDGEVRLKLNAETEWPWVEFHYAGGGSLRFCGVVLAASKHSSPAPQVLFKNLINPDPRKAL